MSIQIEDYLGYWLFYAQRSLAYAFNEALKNCCLEHQKPYAVTPPQWGVLAALTEQDGMTIGAISQKCAVDMPTINGIIKRLEQHGLVKRRHELQDRRQVRVYLTDEGHDIIHYLADAARVFNAIVTKGFTEDQQHDLIANLQHIVVNLGEVGPGTGDRFGLL